MLLVTNLWDFSVFSITVSMVFSSGFGDIPSPFFNGNLMSREESCDVLSSNSWFWRKRFDKLKYEFYMLIPSGTYLVPGIETNYR